MLYDWQKNIAQYIPKELPGYDFVSRIPVYIPVQEIGLTVWERRIQRLSFIQECVMESLDIQARSLSYLSEQFGVPEDIMLQIMMKMDAEQLAAVSAGNIILTENGRQALKAQRKEQVLRNQLSRIFVNQITGEISDVPLVGVYREPPRGQVYLNEVYPISLTFMREHFDTLASIYRENRLENTAFRPGTVESAELYRILDISYHTLSYIRDFCFVYLNQEDKSLAFQFHSGLQRYSDALLGQLNRHENGAWNLCQQPRRLRGPLQIDASLPTGLINALAVSQGQDGHMDAVEEEYYKDRPLLDGEITDILYNCASFRAERILIQAPYLEEFLTGTAIASILSSHTKELTIRYSSDDLRARQVIEPLRRQAGNRKDFQLFLQAVPSVSSVELYFGEKCAIQAQYYPKDTVYRRFIYKLCARVTFDPDRIGQLWDQILE